MFGFSHRDISGGFRSGSGVGVGTAAGIPALAGLLQAQSGGGYAKATAFAAIKHHLHFLAFPTAQLAHRCIEQG